MNDTQHIVVVGASSAIAHDTSRLYAKEGARFTLVGRNLQKLESCKKDLIARGAGEVTLLEQDFSKPFESQNLLGQIQKPIHTTLVAHGILGDQEKLLQCSKSRKELFQTNTMSVIEFTSELIEPMKDQGYGNIAIISSVAGDRGRQSNFFYGTSKAALTAFASGLRNYLNPFKVHVMTVNPGFVSTPMTADIEQGPLFASSKVVARDIKRGLEKRRNILYTPGFWRYIMLIIRNIPENIFKRLKL